MRRPWLISLAFLLAACASSAKADEPQNLVYGAFTTGATHPLTGDAELGPDFLRFYDGRMLVTEDAGAIDIARPAAPGYRSWAEEYSIAPPDKQLVGAIRRRVISETAPPSNGLCGSSNTTFLTLIQFIEHRFGEDHLALLVASYSGTEGEVLCGWQVYWGS